MRTTSLILGLLLVAGVSSVAAQTAAPAASRAVRYVSQQRILAEATAAKAELGKLQQMQQEKSLDLKRRQQELTATRQQLAAAADAPLRASLQQHEVQQRIQLEQMTLQLANDIQAMQRQIVASLQKQLTPILDELLKDDKGVEVVLNSDTSVVWAAPGTDITSAVIELWNARVAAAGRQAR